MKINKLLHERVGTLVNLNLITFFNHIVGLYEYFIFGILDLVKNIYKNKINAFNVIFIGYGWKLLDIYLLAIKSTRYDRKRINLKSVDKVFEFVKYY